MKKILSIIMSTMMILLMITNSVFAASSGKWIDLGQGWKFRVDPPHTGSDTGKYHVHVNYKNKEVGSEGVDGSKSHNDNMKNVPNSIKKQIKNHPEYKKAQQKQKKLEAAKKQIKAKKLKIDWAHIADVIIAIGIVVATTATFFFPGDDVAAWINFFRAIGVT